MSSLKKLPLPTQYLHQIETRNDREIELTNKLATALSQLNLQRVRDSSKISLAKTLAKSIDYFFVCISGIPPFDNEFTNLDLPGQSVVFFLSGLKGKHSDEEYLDIFSKTGFETQANRIRPIIVKKSDEGKKIVIIFHSFGTFTFTTYLKLFKHDHRVSGIIDLGGASIRFYPLLLSFVSNSQGVDPSFMIENSDQIHEAYKQDPVRKKAGFMAFQNKYQTIIQMRLGIDKNFETAFDDIRNYPQVLKLFVYGANDRIFPEVLINEKVVYYSYVNKLDEEYEQKIKKSYAQLYGVNGKNIQERFIFRMEGGQHSIHMQKKFNQDIKKVITQYLAVLSASFG